MGEPETRVVYEFGEFHIDPAHRLLRSCTHGGAIPLTSKAFETLLYLVEHRGDLVEKAIPGARFVLLEGRNHLLLEHDPASVRFKEELAAFLSE